MARNRSRARRRLEKLKQPQTENDPLSMIRYITPKIHNMCPCNFPVDGEAYQLVTDLSFMLQGDAENVGLENAEPCGFHRYKLVPHFSVSLFLPPVRCPEFSSPEFSVSCGLATGKSPTCDLLRTC